jgi:hypothetical protein
MHEVVQEVREICESSQEKNSVFASGTMRRLNYLRSIL